MVPKEETRRTNLRRILDLARRRGPIPQVELARLTGLRPSTISYLTRRLKGAGIIREAGRGIAGPTGGKPTVQLAVNSDFGLFTGALLRGGELTTTRVDFSGAPRRWRHHKLDGSDPEMIFALLETQISADRERAAHEGVGYLGVGFAVSSVVDALGRVHPSADFGYDLRELPYRLRDAAGPHAVVSVENDANSTVIYKYHRSVEPAASILSLVFSRRPVSLGAGLLLDGTLVRGAGGGAGEILPGGRGGDLELADVLAAAAVRFVDPAEVVIAMDQGEGDDLLEEYTDLRREFAGRQVDYVVNPEAAVLGAAHLAYEAVLPRLLSKESLEAVSEKIGEEKG